MSDYYDDSLDEEVPKCHFTPMDIEAADDGCQLVSYFICRHCGHTKEISRSLMS